MAFTLAASLSACSPAIATASAFPTYDPFIPVQGLAPAVLNGTTAPELYVNTSTPPGPTPTRASLTVVIAQPDSDALLSTPTPDPPRAMPTPRQSIDQYVVQSGDTLGSIARAYGISTEALMQANGLSDPNILAIDMQLSIPPPEPGAPGPSFKIIPDSELVFGPASALFDIRQFIQDQAGYLANYAEDVNGEFLAADEIVERVAQNYSVNPRLLLAVLEYQSYWVTDPNPEISEYPVGLQDIYHEGLYLQLTWAADMLNRGYYLWRVNAVSTWVLIDGSIVPADPTINAGTAGVQNLFAQLGGRDVWENDVAPTGFIRSYTSLFGDPFDLTIQPLVPDSLRQPRMTLPFEKGVTWSFTGGPHGGWDSGSAWAALDFGPPGDTASCLPSPAWVTAAADGLILRASNGAVIQDLDNDGYEQTGWVILYMHVDSGDRAVPGTYLFAGQRVGHPSCEGGLSNGTHLHLARRYNGEWIPADGDLPFVLDEWVSSGNGIAYDGFLTRGPETVEAWDGPSDLNGISR